MEDQIILIDKPAGMSSFGVVAKVRGYLRAELGRKVKVGHTGTLDPFATGLLILLTGKNTKKSGEFLKCDKEYVAEMRLGYVSSTGDPEGEIHEYAGRSKTAASLASSLAPVVTGLASSIAPVVANAREAAVLDLSTIQSALQEFIGEIEQRVPQFSAVKINGQRAYKLAREGKEFETPVRKVKIYEIEMLRYEYPRLVIRAKVSSGTYMRTLAEDIGERLGVGAYLTALRRTKIADYDVKDARPLSDFTGEK